ncbi:hypothetical protein ACGFZA_32625 [Streptomyces sp. NPDC048211]|uniref:hypothetical protein n=1 Tax=Streptomyces sp. NPDC048211 TaxID=3365516 RepID=UPI00372308AC
MPLTTEAPQFQWATSLVANEGAGPNARLRVRPQLTIGHWHGHVDQAARVADKLVDNAVRHGKAFADGRINLRMTILADTDELLIEVEDANPEFPNFEEVANRAGEDSRPPTGLWWVAHYRGRMSWDIKKNQEDVAVGKIVQTILPTTWAVQATTGEGQ